MWARPRPQPTWVRPFPSGGKRVVLIDADIGLRNLDVIMGLENRIIYDLVQVIEGVCQTQQAMIRDKLTEIYT